MFRNGPEQCRIKPLCEVWEANERTGKHYKLNVFPINSHYYYFFFLNHNVVDVLFEWLYLENYYLLLVWAAQSMFPVVANVTSATAGREAAHRPLARGQAGGARPSPAQRAPGLWWPSLPSPAPAGPSLQQSLSIILADTGLLQRCGANRGRGGWALKKINNVIITALPNQSWQLCVYFHVILFTWNLHYTRCECMLYLFVV